MKCEVCRKEAIENKVICSEHCQKVRLMIFELIDKYFPSHGCDNCWGDLHGKCSDQCNKEFREGHKFAVDLWNLVFLINNTPSQG